MFCVPASYDTPPTWSHLLIGDSVGHVGRVDHSGHTAQKRHRTVDQFEVAFLVLQ